MIGQYLSNINESVTLSKSKMILDLKFTKIFKIFHHIESLDACMKY